MLTLHTAPLLDTGEGTLLPGGAVAVSGDRVLAVGPLTALRAEHPAARVREWPGLLGPGHVHTGPPPQAPSPRERVHALFARGATALLPGPEGLDPALRAAAARGGLRITAVPTPVPLTAGARADLSVRDGERCLATVCGGRLVYRRR